MFDVWQMLATLVFGVLFGAGAMGCYIALEEKQEEEKQND